MQFSVRVDQKKYYAKDNPESKKRYIYRIKRAIVKSDISLFHQMKKEVDELVQNFHSDFYVHDIEMILNKPNESFIWFVRDFGTHLFHLDNKYLKENIEAVVHNSRIEKTFLYDSKSESLKLISISKAQKIAESLLEDRKLLSA